MIAMPVATFCVSTSSTAFPQQPPTWANVEPTTAQQQPHYNDVFSGMGSFDASEMPAQVHQSVGNATHYAYTYAHNVQSAQMDNYCYAQGFGYFPAQNAQLVYDCSAQQYHTGSPGTSASYSSSSSDSEITNRNGTTFFPVPVAPPSTSEHRLSRYWKQQIYAMVSNFKASEEDLAKNAYPMFKDKLSKTATIAETRYTVGKKQWKSAEDTMRRCTRCQMDFEIGSNGQIGQTHCMYHTKRSVYCPEKNKNVMQCCGEVDGKTEGCELRRYHVYDQMLATELEKFIRTEKARGVKDPRSYKIYAIDCEMVYTISGPALARLSVVNWDGKLVLDVMVKPPTMVIDPNTEYSGLTMEDIEGAKDTLESCRRKFMKLVNEKTILVGHSLESDLKALRIVHPTIVDTSLLYMSNGYKVGLKKLALKHLGLNIQANNASAVGHDSTEDAQVSLQLLKFKMAGCQ